MALTDTAIRNAKPQPKGWKLKDGAKGSRDGGGLYLLVKPNGAKLFRLDYRRPVTGKPNTLSLGAYPAVSLAEARAERDNARRLLAQGIDPGAHRKAGKAAGRELAANSFEAIAREWLAVRAHGWTEKNLQKMTDRLQNHAFPAIGATPISQLGVSDIRPLLTRLVDRGFIEQAHRVCSTISRVFRYAMALEKADRNPADALSDTLPPRPKRNFAHITDPKKIGELLRAIHGYSGTFPVECALKLAPLLFVRPGELRAAEWTEFDFDHPDGPRWEIQPVRRKLSKAAKENSATPPHVVPLPSQAVAILLQLQPLTGRGRFVFPGARSSARPMSDNTINAALRRLGFDKETMTGHGFRHMASTCLNEQGFNWDHVERQLSHVVGGVRGDYNKAQHLRERAEMLQAWADYLDRLRTAVATDVPVGRKAA